jgi:cytochrome c peroxidase
MSAVAVASSLGGWHVVQAQVADGVAGAPDPLPVPQTLKGMAVPEPSNLHQFIQSRAAAIQLGKALFWDMQLGSDGKTACATCHFHAGADSRSRNQLQTRPNHQFTPGDFPFHQLADVNDRLSNVLWSNNFVSGSQGVYNERFGTICLSSTGAPFEAPILNALSMDPFERTLQSCAQDLRSVLADPTFNVAGVNTRRITGRNTPSVINAVFNFRNFWDGRAQYVFNGMNPFGLRDTSARVYQNSQHGMEAVQVAIDNASLASQASGPPLSDTEMSAGGRNFADLGKKMIYLRPLASQQVLATDSVLGALRYRNGMGLNKQNYAEMIRAAFRPEWWNGSQLIQHNGDGSKTLVALNARLAPNQYTQMQQNFSLFFGLALQMYETTLVSDDTPFDRYMTGDSKAMTIQQAIGMGLFFGKGHCANCHTGAEFTNATVRQTKDQPLERMVMGNGDVAVYDRGYYNISVRPTTDDLGNGGSDPFGRPLALSELARGLSNSEFNQLIGIQPNLSVSSSERTAKNGAFKVPTLRNIELTAPYFHNGSAATLRQVVEFYNRGGNFHQANQDDLDPDIEPLGLTEDEKTALVQFLHALTDDRVRFHAAPFDHPQLRLPNGGVGDTASVTNDGKGRTVDAIIELPATGNAGFTKNKLLTPANFLTSANSGSPWVQLITRDAAKCLQEQKTGSATTLLPAACDNTDRQYFRLVAAESGTFRISDEVASLQAGAAGTPNENTVSKVPTKEANTQQHWYLIDLGNGYHQVHNRATGNCLAAPDAKSRTLLQACDSAVNAQQFALTKERTN